MTVIRETGTPGRSDSYVGGGPTSGPAIQSGGSSPFATQTTPTSVNPAPSVVRKEDERPTSGAVIEPQMGGRANEEPPALVPLNIAYHNRGAIRSQPISNKLQDVLRTAAVAAGVDEIRIVSGGQAGIGSGGPRTGSTRHDHGNAADLDLVVNGRVLNFENASDRPIFEKFLTTAVGAGAQGVGAGVDYMGATRLHVGFGAAAAWGAGGSSARAPKWVRTAWQAGMKNPVAIDNTGSALAFTAGTPHEGNPNHPLLGSMFRQTGFDMPLPGERPNPATIFRPGLAGQGGGEGGVPSYRMAPITTNLGEEVVDQKRILERGWRGPAVEELQTFLAWKGIPVEIDGVYGPQTKRAVKTYQMQSDIGVDGRVGPETLQAMLYDIHPSAAVMPGETAYGAGKSVAAKVVDPGGRQVDIRLPGVRPSREVSMRNPTPRPSREVDIPLPKTDPRDNRTLRSDIRVLANGQDTGALEESTMEMIRRDSAAAAELATRQRLGGFQSGSDRYGVGSTSLRIAEAFREAARGVGDAYREAIEMQKMAAGVAERAKEEARRAGEAVTDAALAAEPNAANTVVDAYVFGPAGDPGAIEDFRRYEERRKELARRQLWRDMRRGRTPGTGNSVIPWGS